MPAIRIATCRGRTCYIGMAHLNHGTPLLFMWICGRSGSSRTPPKSSPWYDLGKTAEERGTNKMHVKFKVYLKNNGKCDGKHTVNLIPENVFEKN